MPLSRETDESSRTAYFQLRLQDHSRMNTVMASNRHNLDDDAGALHTSPRADPTQKDRDSEEDSCGAEAAGIALQVPFRINCTQKQSGRQKSSSKKELQARTRSRPTSKEQSVGTQTGDRPTRGAFQIANLGAGQWKVAKILNMNSEFEIADAALKAHDSAQEQHYRPRGVIPTHSSNLQKQKGLPFSRLPIKKSSRRAAGWAGHSGRPQTGFKRPQNTTEAAEKARETSGGVKADNADLFGGRTMGSSKTQTEIVQQNENQSTPENCGDSEEQNLRQLVSSFQGTLQHGADREALPQNSQNSRNQMQAHLQTTLSQPAYPQSVLEKPACMLASSFTLLKKNSTSFKNMRQTFCNGRQNSRASSMLLRIAPQDFIAGNSKQLQGTQKCHGRVAANSQGTLDGSGHGGMGAEMKSSSALGHRGEQLVQAIQSMKWKGSSAMGKIIAVNRKKQQILLRPRAASQLQQKKLIVKRDSVSHQDLFGGGVALIRTQSMHNHSSLGQNPSSKYYPPFSQLKTYQTIDKHPPPLMPQSKLYETLVNQNNATNLIPIKSGKLNNGGNTATQGATGVPGAPAAPSAPALQEKSGAEKKEPGQEGQVNIGPEEGGRSDDRQANVATEPTNDWKPPMWQPINYQNIDRGNSKTIVIQMVQSNDLSGDEEESPELPKTAYLRNYGGSEEDQSQMQNGAGNGRMKLKSANPAQGTQNPQTHFSICSSEGPPYQITEADCRNQQVKRPTTQQQQKKQNYGLVRSLAVNQQNYLGYQSQSSQPFQGGNQMTLLTGVTNQQHQLAAGWPQSTSFGTNSQTNFQWTAATTTGGSKGNGEVGLKKGQMPYQQEITIDSNQAPMSHLILTQPESKMDLESEFGGPAAVGPSGAPVGAQENQNVTTQTDAQHARFSNSPLIQPIPLQFCDLRNVLSGNNGQNNYSGEKIAADSAVIASFSSSTDFIKNPVESQYYQAAPGEVFIDEGNNQAFHQQQQFYSSQNYDLNGRGSFIPRKSKSVPRLIKKYSNFVKMNQDLNQVKEASKLFPGELKAKLFEKGLKNSVNFIEKSHQGRFFNSSFESRYGKKQWLQDSSLIQAPANQLNQPVTNNLSFDNQVGYPMHMQNAYHQIPMQKELVQVYDNFKPGLIDQENQSSITTTVQNKQFSTVNTEEILQNSSNFPNATADTRIDDLFFTENNLTFFNKTAEQTDIYDEVNDKKIQNINAYTSIIIPKKPKIDRQKSAKAGSGKYVQLSSILRTTAKPIQMHQTMLQNAKTVKSGPFFSWKKLKNAEIQYLNPFCSILDTQQSDRDNSQKNQCVEPNPISSRQAQRRYQGFKRTKSTLPRNMEYYVNRRRQKMKLSAKQKSGGDEDKQGELVVVGKQQKKKANLGWRNSFAKDAGLKNSSGKDQKSKQSHVVKTEFEMVEVKDERTNTMKIAENQDLKVIELQSATTSTYLKAQQVPEKKSHNGDTERMGVTEQQVQVLQNSQERFVMSQTAKNAIVVPQSGLGGPRKHFHQTMLKNEKIQSSFNNTMNVSTQSPAPNCPLSHQITAVDEEFERAEAGIE